MIRVLSNGDSMRTAAFIIVGTALALVLTGCGGSGSATEDMPNVPDKDRTAVQVASSRQLQIGYQLLAVASQDDALDFCHEMCSRSGESCALSVSLCNYSTTYPEVVALNAKCRVSRERCRQHRARIPRQCACEHSEDS